MRTDRIEVKSSNLALPGCPLWAIESDEDLLGRWNARATLWRTGSNGRARRHDFQTKTPCRATVTLSGEQPVGRSVGRGGGR